MPSALVNCLISSRPLRKRSFPPSRRSQANNLKATLRPIPFSFLLLTNVERAGVMSSTPGQGNGGRLDGAAEHADGDRQDIANSSSFEKRDGKRSVVELDIPSERNAGHSKISFLRHQSQRQKTNLALVPVETRHVAHKYLIRRPRALQVQYKGRHIELGDEGRVDVSEFEAQIGRSEALSEQTSHSSETSTEGKGERRSTDKTEVQRGMF